MWTSVLYFNNKEESSNGSKCWLQETIILQNNMKNKPSLGFEVHYIVFLLDVNESCINMMNIYETATTDKRCLWIY